MIKKELVKKNFSKSTNSYDSFANVQNDTIEVHTETALHETAHAEPQDVKSKIKSFVNHHVLDSHDFTFFSDEAEPFLKLVNCSN